MRTPHLVIVGGGPLCTYAVERLAALLPTVELPAGLRITVYDRTGRFGAGDTHSDVQAGTSYMNRVASQIAFAADESNVGAGPLLPRALRPTFYEWARAKYAETGDERFDLRPTDVPHRYLHGIALREAFERYRSILASIEGVRIDVRVDEVVEIAPGRPGGCDEAPFVLRTAGAPGEPVPADHLLLVTGHPDNHPAPGSLAAGLADHARRHPPARFVGSAYPLDRRVTTDAVPPGSTVGLLGLGLTAIDVMLHLTEGRGGRFEPVEAGNPQAGLRYVPCGAEPVTIVAVSPSGMPVSARARNEKAADGSAVGHTALEHRPVFLDVDAVRALRRHRGTPGAPPLNDVRQLDFGRHVFPLVVLEMAYVYYTTLLGPGVGPQLRDAVGARYGEFLTSGPDSPDAAIEWLLGPLERLDALDAAGHRFDWRRLFEPIDECAAQDGSAWHDALVRYLRDDLAAAEQGNISNPVKAACDGVWRDLRGVLSAACDFGGLTPRSHRETLEKYLRYYTRMSNGSGTEAMHKVLALLDAGFVDLSIGPRPTVEPVPGAATFRLRGGLTSTVREVEVVVEGKAHPFDADNDVNPLYRSMIRHGLLRLFRNPGRDGEPDFVPGGIAVSPDFHPVLDDGTTDRRITAFGAPVEGVALFQLSAGRPRSNSSVLNHAAGWAIQFVDAVSSAPALTADPLTGVGTPER